jgi:predicted ATP-binding protein involved in virulence
VSTAILQMLNNDADDVQFKRLYIDPSVFNNYQLVLEKGTERINVHQLSSGEKSLLVLVSDLARRLALANPLSKNPLKDGQGIVLIDEIDLHLHPRWQRAVIPKLRSIFPEIQWVITTHSPQVLMNVKRENVKVINHGKIEEAPFIEGRDANALSLDVFGLPKRLPKYEAMLDKIHDLIDNGEEKQAQIELESLKQIWGNDDLDMHRAESFLEML